MDASKVIVIMVKELIPVQILMGSNIPTQDLLKMGKLTEKENKHGQMENLLRVISKMVKSQVTVNTLGLRVMFIRVSGQMIC